jgi:starch phosphorylase
MEFGIDQAFKIYSGGLGYLAGSHMRSAYALKQNFIGIGILWKYGYYDQMRSSANAMSVNYIQRYYNFLEDTGIQFEIFVHNSPVRVKAYYLAPSVFGTVPMYFLTTDLPENDYLAQTISHHLYDPNLSARIAQYMLLGLGGAKLLDIIGYDADYYHFNEAHALSAVFHLLRKENLDLSKIQQRVVFTTHTPEAGGNDVTDIYMLEQMGFFNGIPLSTVRELFRLDGNFLDHTLTALRASARSNGVSKMHGDVANQMWQKNEGICEISSITNAQNKAYWADQELQKYLDKDDDKKLVARKKEMKKKLFSIVADQAGKIFDENVLTIVWARRFAGYKRADLLVQDFERFSKLMSNKKYPVQMIWAGKPFPTDHYAVNTINHLMGVSHAFPNCAVLVGYELALSKALKDGSDVWLNTPRITREASGTSGMTAAMNGSVNLSAADGWIPEFAEHGHNAFVISPLEKFSGDRELDDYDRNQFFNILEKEILPTYYDRPDAWTAIVKNGMREVTPAFDADRMADEYYEKLYL